MSQAPSNIDQPQTARWQSLIWTKAAGNLWMLALGILAILFMIGGGILLIVWTQKSTNNPDFLLCGMALAASTVLKMVSVLVGAGLCFSGVAISFFAHEKSTTINAFYGQEAIKPSDPLNISQETHQAADQPKNPQALPLTIPRAISKPSAAVALSAYSPGIVAVIFGSIIISISSIKITSLDCPATTHLASNLEKPQLSGADLGMAPPKQRATKPENTNNNGEHE